jgi:hypothetical protein
VLVPLLHRLRPPPERARQHREQRAASRSITRPVVCWAGRGRRTLTTAV